MDNAKILSRAQAEAVYSAMCALNKIGAGITSMDVRDESFNLLRVTEHGNGIVEVFVSLRKGDQTEFHASAELFAITYGLHGAALAKAQGGAA